VNAFDVEMMDNSQLNFITLQHWELTTFQHQLLLQQLLTDTVYFTDPKQKEITVYDTKIIGKKSLYPVILPGITTT
jgi:hypothetical protein